MIAVTSWKSKRIMKNKKAVVLVVDDEKGVRQSFKMVLKDDYTVFLAESEEEAIDLFKKKSIDLVLLDIRLQDADGIELLQKFRELDPNVEIIMVTAVKEIQTAVRAIKLGAYEYVIKPFNVDDVLTIINRALEKRSLLRQLSYLKGELEHFKPFEKMVGNDVKMREVFELISSVAESSGSVLIQGESGTGKELVARAIHNLSPRRDQPFVVINCAAIPATLMESQLFGHTKGAFTGATSTTTGKMEIANRGTAFLDDVDTLDTGMQAKLLRVLQEKEIERLGSTKLIKADVRFVAASNKDLENYIEEGKFREDFYYRLNVFPVKVPPLRERISDIPLLIDHFLKTNARNGKMAKKKFSKGAIKILKQYEWPGNVRELQNMVERLSTVTKGPVIHSADLSGLSITKKEPEKKNLKNAVYDFEKQYIIAALEQADGSKKKAAELLGIHRNTLLIKMTQYDLQT